MCQSEIYFCGTVFFLLSEFDRKVMADFSPVGTSCSDVAIIERGQLSVRYFEPLDCTRAKRWKAFYRSALSCGYSVYRVHRKHVRLCHLMPIFGSHFELMHYLYAPKLAFSDDLTLSHWLYGSAHNMWRPDRVVDSWGDYGFVLTTFQNDPDFWLSIIERPLFSQIASPVLIDMWGGTEIALSQSTVLVLYNWQTTVPDCVVTDTGAVV